MSEDRSEENDKGSVDEQDIGEFDEEDELDQEEEEQSSEGGSKELDEEKIDLDFEDEEKVENNQEKSVKKVKEQKGPGLNFQLRFQQIMSEQLSKDGKMIPILAKSPQIEQNIEKEKFEAAVDKEVRQQKKEFQLRNYVIPDPNTDVAFEKMVKRVATRGVVKLFNLVMQHKQTLDKNGELETQKPVGKPRLENLSKRKFLELLKNTVKKADNGEDSKKIKLNDKKNSKWEVLDNEYMMNKPNLGNFDEDEEEEDKYNQKDSSSDGPSYSNSDE